MSKIDRARQAAREHPEKTSREIASMLGISHTTVNRARRDVPRVPLQPLDVPPEHDRQAELTVLQGENARLRAELAGAREVIRAYAQGGTEPTQPGPVPVRSRTQVAGDNRRTVTYRRTS